MAGASSSSSSPPAEAAHLLNGGESAAASGGSARQQIASLVRQSLAVTFPGEWDLEPLVAACRNKFGDYQCTNAMGIWSKIRGTTSEFMSPKAVGKAIAENLPSCSIIEWTNVAGPGFVNVFLSNRWIEERIHMLLIDGVGAWAPNLLFRRAVVDFSSPNIAKEMHVGHLRPTIIGHCIAQMLEYCKVQVLRRNHVGDWGTQFGMVIEYLFEEYPDLGGGVDLAVRELQVMYKAANEKFDIDPVFKEKAQRAVVRLQSGEERYRQTWQQICDVNRRAFQQVYEQLKVSLEERVHLISCL